MLCKAFESVHKVNMEKTTSRVEKTMGAMKERSLSLAHTVTGTRRFNDEDALLDGVLHRETSVQGCPVGT